MGQFNSYTKNPTGVLTINRKNGRLTFIHVIQLSQILMGSNSTCSGFEPSSYMVTGGHSSLPDPPVLIISDVVQKCNLEYIFRRVELSTPPWPTSF